MRIETLRRHRLVVPVPENDVAEFPEGTQADSIVPAFPRTTSHASLMRIAHAVDIKTRTMSVELDEADPHAEWVPGRFAEWRGRRGPLCLSLSSNLERTFVIRGRNRRAEGM